MAWRVTSAREDEWLWGWDPTPGIVSVFATADGRATIWRRTNGTLVREEARFRPWVLLASLDDLAHVGRRLAPERGTAPDTAFTYEELSGPGELRWLVRATDGRALAREVLDGGSRRLGTELRSLRDFPDESCLALPPEEQYLTLSGRTHFRDLEFDDLRRLTIDLETTGLDPSTGRIFLAAIRSPNGDVTTLEADDDPDVEDAEIRLIENIAHTIRAIDPDVIENHNLHGFDLPFLAERARLLGARISLGREGPAALGRRPAARGARLGAMAEDHPMRRARYTVPGRELIDSLDAVRRHDFAARELPGHGLKAVARHLGLSHDARELIPGAQIFEVHRRDPERVRRYAMDDVREASALARVLGGAAFALARMVPRRYDRLADAGAATGVIDPLLVRAYLRERQALPIRARGDGTEHSGAALHLFATGVAHRIVKADVASLYPSLMRSYRIGPKRDRLGAFLSMIDRLVEQRLAAKRAAKSAPKGSPERHAFEAMSAAMKLVVNSAYGYLGATHLTRFADVHAANEVTRRGREVLALICRELKARGVTLIEADTDGVYFSVSEHFDEAGERALVADVARLLPPLVELELEGRYAAMLSHEPKNYALAPYGGGPPLLRGVAFRSSRAEPYGERFLEKAIPLILAGDIVGVRAEYVAVINALRKRELPTLAVASRVKLTKTPKEYEASRHEKRELPYEAVRQSGRATWTAGEQVLVYRATGGRPALAVDSESEDDGTVRTAVPTGRADRRDYDVETYVRILRETFAERLSTALRPEDFREVFADPVQPSLFARDLSEIRPVLVLIDDG